MARYKRITKKTDIKGPDEFIGFWSRAFAWIGERKDQLLLPALGLAVAVALVFGFIYFRQQKEASASRELFTILTALPRSGNPKAEEIGKSLESLNAYNTKFSGTKPSRISQLYAANLLFEKAHWDEAASIYRTVHEGSKDVLSQAACLGLAAVLQEQGKFSEAVALLEKNREGSYFNEDIDYLIARNQELANNKSAAVKEYRKFMDKYPNSQFTEEARERISKLS